MDCVSFRDEGGRDAQGATPPPRLRAGLFRHLQQKPVLPKLWMPGVGVCATAVTATTPTITNPEGPVRGGTPRGERTAGTKAILSEGLKIRTARKTLRWPEWATGPAARFKLLTAPEWLKPDIREVLTLESTEAYTVLALVRTACVGWATGRKFRTLSTM